MKVGLVLEGGGMRGMFTCGVLDTLMDENIDVDLIIGTSAGALFGINYFSNQKKRAIRYNMKYAKDIRYMSRTSYLLTGNLVNKNFAFYKITTKKDPFDNDTFMKNNKDFYAVATDIDTGKPEYLKITNPVKELEKLRASSALPLASKVVEIDNKKYLDGGISDAIPLDKALDFGLDKIIVVLTRPKGYRKKPLSDKSLNKINKKFKDYPKLLSTMKNRYKNYNNTLDKIDSLEKNNKIFVIRPKENININIVKKDRKLLKNAYDLGIDNTKEVLNNLKEYLKTEG